MLMNRRNFMESSSAVLAAGALTAVTAQASEPEPKPNRKYKLIATEEAFSIPEQADEFRRIAGIAYPNTDLNMWRGFLNPQPAATPLLKYLLDLEGERIQIMDEAGVDMHLLSLTSPGVQMFDADTATNLAITANDRLAEVIKKNPKRFTGLASFAPQDPNRAAKEIDRVMNQLKLNGLIVNSHTTKRRIPGQPEVLADLRGGDRLQRGHLHPSAQYAGPVLVHDARRREPDRRAMGLSDGNRAARDEADREWGIRSVSHAEGGAGAHGRRDALLAVPHGLHVQVVYGRAQKTQEDAEPVREGQHPDHDERDVRSQGAEVLQRGARAGQHYIRDRLSVSAEFGGSGEFHEFIAALGSGQREDRARERGEAVSHPVCLTRRAVCPTLSANPKGGAVGKSALCKNPGKASILRGF